MTPRALMSRDVRRLRTLSFLLSLCLCAAPLSAFAQGTPDAEVEEPGGDAQDDVARVEALSEQGAVAFGAGDFKQAIALFEEAYAISPVANLLYNIALCHERLNDPVTAARYYKQFILAPDADAEVRAVALARMEEIEQATRGSKVGALDGDQAGGSAPQQTPPPGAPSDSGGLGSAGAFGIVTASAGVLLLGAGGVLGVLALNDQDNFNKARDPLTKAQAQDDAETKALAADILMGAGAAALITGTILLVVDLTGDSESASDAESDIEAGLRWRPVISPQGVGAVLEVPFTGH